MRTRRLLALGTLVLTLGSLLFVTLGSAAPSGISEFQKSGISGSGAGTMTTMTLPANIDRVSIRKDGSGEAWALGTSAARLPGWNPNNESQGQVVFLRYLPSTGWQMTGPPTNSNGTVVNPVLSDMAIAPNGEGWAVGAQGTFLYHAPGSTTWVERFPSNRTSQLLQSVSLAEDQGKTVGYASGQGSTIYRYIQDQGWSLEPTPPAMTADLSPGLFVAAISRDAAWAVSDSLQTNGVKIYQRTGGTWIRRLVGDPILDSPPATGQRGGYNSKAWGSAIAATRSTVWVGGAMQPGEGPFTPPNEAESDVTRPFMVSFDASSTSGNARDYYCPNLYRLRQKGDAPIDTTLLCKKPFPIAAYDIPSISIVGNEAYAGGQGLFHFDGNSWFREPNTNGYLISVTMASVGDGWVATSGSTYLRGLSIRSNSPYVGRWTTPSKAPHPAVARWPQTQEHALESIAMSPDGRSALAVGQDGAAVYFGGQLGWDKRLPNASVALHGVAWPDRRPWVVGEQGFIGRFDPGTRKWSYDSAYARYPTLFGVAFRSPTDGVAVGAGGTIIAYNGSGWRKVASPTDETLYSVAVTPNGYVAVGGKGAIVQTTGGAWTAHRELAGVFEKEPYSSPALYSVTVMSNGRIVAGGQRGALAVSDAGGPFRLFEPVLQGTVLALASGEGDRLFASVSPDESKFNPTGSIQPMRGSVLMLREHGWQDISLNRRIRVSNRHDSSSFDDPVMSMVMESGTTGWAVGGSAAGNPDLNPPEGHLRTAPYDSGSVYRIDLAGDPKPKNSFANVRMPGGINFAVFGESWCGRPKGSTTPSGLCSSAVGTGTQPDLVALRIRDEINRIAYPKNPNGPRFVLFTGNMRQAGVPEELAEFKSYLAGFDIPVYSAIGNTDLYSGLAGDLTTVNNANTSGSNDYWKETFFDMARPWGRGTFVKTPSYIRPVDVRLPTAVVNPDNARTHYAFDVLHNGSAALRVIVLDSSTKSYGNAADQEPQFEGQGEWLQAVIGDAKLLTLPIIVAMNQPTVIPGSVQIPNWNNQADKTTFENAVVTGGITAVFASGLRKNASDSYPQRRDVVPLYIVGGGGAPLGFEGTQPPVGPPTGPLVPASLLPSDGYYHGWHLVNIDPDPGSRNVLGQAPHTLKTFMALEYLGIHALDGDQIRAGDAVRFQGFGRQLPGGWSLPDQARSSTFQLGFPFAPPCTTDGDGDIYCQSVNAIRPPYRFYSENTKIAQFVVPSPIAGYTTPFIHPKTNAMVADVNGLFGFLCTFDKGTVGINLESGMINRRMVINVGPGEGPCVKFPVQADPDLPLARPNPADPQEPPDDPPPVFRPPSLLPDPIAIVLPPAPGPVAAPAPPASAATSRKEEEEHQTQTEGQEGEGEANFMAISHQRQSVRFDPMLGWVSAGASTLMGMMLAFGLAFTKKTPKREYVRCSRR